MYNEVVIAGKYQLVKKLGNGAFGEVLSAIDVIAGIMVAVKLEKLNKNKVPQLLLEAKWYKYMQGNEGVPLYYWSGTEGEYNILVIQILGSSIENLINGQRKKFTLKTTLMLSDQMLTRIETFHNKGLIHRDIKPDNFLIGTGENYNIVYIIDYGLVKRFRDPKSKIHIPFKNNKKLTGTARYCSINTHLGIEQSRRDDIEGLGYCLVYFMKGELPWQGIKADDKKVKYEKIMEKKVYTPIELICKDLPSEFSALFYYVKSLQFEDKPDYGYCKKLFRELFYKEKFDAVPVFDWVPHNSSQFLNALSGGNRLNCSKNDSLKCCKESQVMNPSNYERGTEQGNAKSALNISKEVKEEGVNEPKPVINNLAIPDEFDEMEIPQEHALPVRIVVPVSKYESQWKRKYDRGCSKSFLINYSRVLSHSISNATEITVKYIKNVNGDLNRLARQGLSLMR